MSSTTTPSRPVLIFDGECGICRRWVEYWRALTGERVDYRAYQEAAADFAWIPVAEFRRAIQLVEPDGRVFSGAAATFRVLRHAPGRAGWSWAYEHLPGFSALSEAAYAFFARHRGLLAHLTRWLWGRTLEPPRYSLVCAVFLRGLGLVYLAAFASLSVQIVGLVGAAGIVPIESLLHALREHLGSDAYRMVPTLFWIDASDTALAAGTYAGMALALLVVAGVATRASLIALFALYLSYAYAGQDFMAFQWDLLLLEAGFLAIFLTGGSRIVVWLFRWLVFRYLFMAGAVKLTSGDMTWRTLSALHYHFETQPLPTPIAWYAANLPEGLLNVLTAATLLIEVAVVFLVFAPRRLRAAAGCCVIVFQVLVALTGNYNFFNLLTMLLCIFLFDDAALRHIVPARVAARITQRAPRPGRTAAAIATAVALAVVPVGINRLWRLFSAEDLPVAGAMTRLTSPVLIVNAYGLFAVMTTRRPEIIVEGSDDGSAWRGYAFRYKPGDVTRRPTWNIPHQPRLDWQMWFAALSSARQEPWFAGFVRRLLENSRPVLGLLASNPFPDHPPRYVRALLYVYRFADRRERQATGNWWVRQLAGIYFPPVALADFERAEAGR